MFRVGDILIGLSNQYIITSLNSLVKVIEIHDEENIAVEVIKPGERVDRAGSGLRPREFIGVSYDVNARDFRLQILNKGRC